jgi:hypothetical protein
MVPQASFVNKKWCQKIIVGVQLIVKKVQVVFMKVIHPNVVFFKHWNNCISIVPLFCYFLTYDFIIFYFIFLSHSFLINLFYSFFSVFILSLIFYRLEYFSNIIV